MKIQRMKDLIAEMREVARGETPASADAALPSVNRLRLSFVFSRRTTAAYCASFGTPGLNRLRNLPA